MHSVPVIMCFKTHVSILYFRHPFDYQIIYLINTSSASNSTSVDKLIHLIMEFILFMTPASFRCGALLLMVILVVYKYKNR